MITAAVVSIVFKLLKQPVVLGYIVAGVLVGPNLHFLYHFGASTFTGWLTPSFQSSNEANHSFAVW